MLIQKEKSCLILIDVQEKLTPLVTHADTLVSNCHWLMRLASALDVPLLVTEEYREGLGPTVEPLRSLMPGETDIDKVFFSCHRDSDFQKHWQMLNKSQAILTGIETHVCVLQTAMDLRTIGVDVFVVVDAVNCRDTLDHQCALERMQQAGIHLVTREMVFFEWMEQCGTPEFKALNEVFIKGNK
ncbi:MAG: isochorismatase family protein [Gammaproteobacteria bacterium]|nr:isochorismatase family protein [Gammaproteobacteria bacterium]